MTRFIVFVLYFATITASELLVNLPPEIPQDDSKNSDIVNTVVNTEPLPPPVVLQKQQIEETTVQNANNTLKNGTISNQSSEIVNNVNYLNHNKSQSAALERLFFVLLGLCTLTLLYVSYRFYRTRKGGSRPTTVRKYGVLTQRTDVEMLPLPLEDEEDDDTVFDVGNHVNR